MIICGIYLSNKINKCRPLYSWHVQAVAVNQTALNNQPHRDASKSGNVSFGHRGRTVLAERTEVPHFLFVRGSQSGESKTKVWGIKVFVSDSGWAAPRTSIRSRPFLKSCPGPTVRAEQVPFKKTTTFYLPGHLSQFLDNSLDHSLKIRR